MSDMPKFNNVVQRFIEQSLKTGAGIGKIIEDIAEIYPQFKAAAEDKQARDMLYQRIKKIKARLPKPEAHKAAWETIPHDLSAEWRVAYFRALLNATADVSVKIRLLKEIRTEVAIIDKQNTAEEPDRKEAYEQQQEEQKREKWAKIDAYRSRDPQSLADGDGYMSPGRHGETNFALKSYEKIGDGQYRRVSDGVVVDKDGTPEKVGDPTHREWLAAQEERGLYIYDPKLEAEVLPSPLVLDKAHREVYDVACQQGWIFAESVLPVKAYDKITNYRYCDYEYRGDCPENQYRRICDGVVVDKLGIPFTAGEKDHHTWLYEQEGIYNYDPDVADKLQTITDVLAKQETEESKQV